MGVSSTTNRIAYAGNGSTQAFSFPYYIFKTTDLNLYVYDTLAGGVTTYTLGSGFTVAGTANSQGIYPTGVVATFSSYMPLSTDIVVLLRNPPDTQTFSILENGIIPSATLIQQFDYLTLLIQRLQDLASRSMTMADGQGSTFNPVLPANMTLAPLMFLQINAAGTGFQLASGPTLATTPWQSVTFTYLQLQAAAVSNTALVVSLPANAILSGLAVKHSAAFTGGAISACIAQLGIASDSGKFVDNFDIFQAPSDTAFANSGTAYIASFVSATALNLKVVATGANLNALTSGSVTVFFKYELL